MKELLKTELRQNYQELILDCGPYSHFMTVTYRDAQSRDECDQQLNFLLYLLNKRLFGRKNSDHLEGFAFAERHKCSRQSTHYHLIFKEHASLNDIGERSFETNFNVCLEKVKHRVTDKKVFNPKHCELKPIYEEDGLVRYLTKSFEYSSDATFIIPLTRSGIQ